MNSAIWWILLGTNLEQMMSKKKKQNKTKQNKTKNKIIDLANRATLIGQT